MTTERIQAHIERLLDEIDNALISRNWQEVHDLASDVTDLDEENSDALAFLRMAERRLGATPAPAVEAHTPTEAPVAPEAPVLPTPPAQKQTPTSFSDGRYEVNRFLGEGGKKMVYLAHDTLLDRDVAFALIKTEGLDFVGLTRINREAQAMGRLGSHPHIVTVFDLGDHVGQPFMVTELMGGGDVEGILEDAPQHRLSLEQTISIASETCRGLEFAHSRGIVHRDLKPGNVWLTADGVAKIGDFGLAVASDRSRLTQEGMMVGTVSYMPPEQAMGGDVTHRADLYSLGAMLYEMVTGRPPFLGDDSVSIIGQHINTPPVSPTWHNGECPRPLEALILRLLAKNPEERPGSASDVLTVLDGLDPSVSMEAPAVAGTETSDQGTNALDSVAQGVFVGRQQEMGDLKAGLEDVLSGRGRMMTLVGEPGIGKTRTSQELATYAGLRGARVLWGRCYEEQGVPPYWPWVQAIRSYVRDTEPQRLSTEMGAGAADIAEVVSDVKTQLPGLQPAPQLEPEQARFRLFDSITAFLRSASEARPLVIILDDLHWADKPSLLLLQFVAREIANSRLLLIGTYRDVELSRQHPLAESLGELTRERAFQRVLLRGLSQQDVERFVEVAAGVRADTALVNAVYTQTEGNPLFVTEVVRLLVQEGQLGQNGGASSSATGRQTESWTVRIPEGVREVIGRRLNRLSERCNDSLTMASIVGREFEFDQIKALVEDLSEDMLLDVLEEALAARVIEELPDSVGRYQFTHALLQETLMDELSLTRRVRLHARIAESLETLYGEHSEDHAAELAFHFEQAQAMVGTDKLVRYSMVAGQRALDNSAFEEAQAFFEQALFVLQNSPMNSTKANLLFGLGRACVASTNGTTETVINSFASAFDYYRQSKMTAMAVEVSTFPVPLNLGLSDSQSLGMLERSLDIVGSNSIEAAQVHIRYALAAGLMAGDYRAASEHLDTARDIADRLGEWELQLGISSNRSAVDWFHLKWDSALEESSRALALADKVDDPVSEWNATIWALNARISGGDLLGAQQVEKTAVSVAEQLRNRNEVALSHALCARVWDTVGNWNKARQHYTESLSLSPVQTQALFGLTLLEIQNGDIAGGLTQLRTLEKVAEATPRGPNLPWAQFGLANMIASRLTGEKELMSAGIAVADFLIGEGGSPYVELMANTSVALGPAEGLDPKTSLRVLESVTGKLFVGLAVDRIIGNIYFKIGDHDKAITYLEQSVDFTRRSGAVVELAWALYDYANVLTELSGEDNQQHAVSLLHESLEISRNLSMKPLMEKILERREILKA